MQCIYRFPINFRINSGYFPEQHEGTVLFNGEELCFGVRIAFFKYCKLARCRKWFRRLAVNP
jgi:hypothetical protein